MTLNFFAISNCHLRTPPKPMFLLSCALSKNVDVELGGWKCKAIVHFSCGIPSAWKLVTVACF